MNYHSLYSNMYNQIFYVWIVCKYSKALVGCASILASRLSNYRINIKASAFPLLSINYMYYYLDDMFLLQARLMKHVQQEQGLPSRLELPEKIINDLGNSLQKDNAKPWQ